VKRGSTCRIRRRLSVILPLLAGFVLAGPPSGLEDWPQWGGPRRDFTSETTALADSWPAEGPRRVWARDLGEGYSGIVLQGATLWTMYSEPASEPGGGGREVVAALDAGSGKTLWEHRYEAPPLPGMALENGAGPHSTPLLAGDRLFTIGVTGRLHSLEKGSGKVVWSKRALEDLQGSVLGRGYSSSPLAYQDLVIVPVGGPGRGMAAFDQRDGALHWKSQDFRISHSSPVLLSIDGRDQLAAIVDRAIVGIDPRDGKLLWSLPQPTIGDHIASTPVWDGGHLLFVSCAYDGGTRGIRLSAREGNIETREVWFTNQMRVHHSNALLSAGFAYASSGDFGPSFYTAIALETGAIAWRSREITRVSGISAGGKLLLLEEDGRLDLARASPQGLEVLARAQVLEGRSWTPPALVGKRLFLRNRKVIACLELP
jgi:outer membrane protein assembly factor BamB